MALNDILKKIGEAAEKQAQTIIQEAEKKAEGVKAELSAEQKEATKTFKAKQKTALERFAEKAAGMATREGKRGMLAAKRDVVDETLQGVYDHLLSLSDSDYASVLKPLFGSIANKPAKILCPEKRLEITQKQAPSSCEVVASEALKGGFIVQYKDAMVDNSFRNLVFSEYKDGLTHFIAKQYNFI